MRKLRAWLVRLWGMPQQKLQDQQFAEEMRLARAAPAIGALVARWLQQRLEYPSGPNFQDRQ